MQVMKHRVALLQHGTECFATNENYDGDRRVVFAGIFPMNVVEIRQPANQPQENLNELLSQKITKKKAMERCMRNTK